ncbi:MAG: hypothetical protein IJ512_05900 [Ruminococcus sp.]|nr:hypothetical protein [Ruminococcus sp.]
MVKGVHKKIIEVRHPESDYFEKAVFYLRPGVTQLPPQLAETAAQMFLHELEEPKKRLPLWRKIAGIAGIFAVTAVISVCAVLLQ